MPTTIRVLLLLCLAAVLTLAMVLLARATYKGHRLRGTDDVETAYVTALATLYGIFVAFMIFSVWTKYNDAQDSVAAEANQVAEVYRLAGGLDDPLKGRIRGLMVGYSHSVVDHEWDTMTRGRFSPHTQRVVEAMWQQVNRMGPNTVSDSVLRDHLLTAWSKTTEQRRLRLGWSSTGLAPIAYALLIVGGLITLGLASFFTVDDFRAHVVKASALGFVIVLMLGAIWGLDHPFGDTANRIQPDPFVEMLQWLSSNKTSSSELPPANAALKSRRPTLGDTPGTTPPGQHEALLPATAEHRTVASSFL